MTLGHNGQPLLFYVQVRFKFRKFASRQWGIIKASTLSLSSDLASFHHVYDADVFNSVVDPDPVGSLSLSRNHETDQVWIREAHKKSTKIIRIS